MEGLVYLIEKERRIIIDVIDTETLIKTHCYWITNSIIIDYLAFWERREYIYFLPLITRSPLKRNYDLGGQEEKQPRR